MDTPIDRRPYNFNVNGPPGHRTHPGQRFRELSELLTAGATPPIVFYRNATMLGSSASDCGEVLGSPDQRRERGS